MIKYCLSSRQPEQILRQADEIRVITKDQSQIFDLLDQYTTPIVYNYSSEKPLDKTLVALAKAKSPQVLTLCILNLSDLQQAREYELPYFFAQPCKTLDEVRSFITLGANQIMPDTPLTHQLSQLKLLRVPVRYNPVYSHLDNIPRANGVTGNWIIPQSLPDYELYISTIDFGSQPLKREETLFKLYKSQYYGGELHRLIPDLETVATADLLQPNHLSSRIDCGQECVYPRGRCQICYNLLQLENLLDPYRDLKFEIENQNS